MLLELFRRKSNEDATVGELYINGSKSCFALEDEKREVKVMHETRIPAGTYEIKLQKNGEMTKKYAKEFPGIHEGMLWLQNVPNFQFIYIHIGNTDEDTSGCVLLGKQEQDFKLINSTEAYLKVYVAVVNSILINKEKVEIKIVDEPK
jgi:hypothetical protein